MTINNPRPGHDDISPREQVDLLVSRIADGEASDHDWSAFTTLAERDTDAWKMLAHAQRQHGELSLAVGVALHAADRAELPTRSGAAYAGSGGAELSPVVARVRAWGGWAVAAAVALAWLSGQQLGVISPRPNPGGNQAGLVPAGWSSDDFASAYLKEGQKEGRVYGELAARPIEIRPLTNGTGYDVVYVRQIVERARVNDLVKFGVDESGRSVPLRYNLPVQFTDPQ